MQFHQYSPKRSTSWPGRYLILWSPVRPPLRVSQTDPGFGSGAAVPVMAQLHNKGKDKSSQLLIALKYNVI